MISAFVFAGLLLVAVGAFVWTTHRLYRNIRMGQPDLSWKPLGRRIKGVLVYWLAQKKVGEPASYQVPAGVTSKHHYFIFWGFLLITLGTGEFLLQGLFPRFNLSFLGPVYTLLRWSIDLFTLLVLVLVGYAFFRRVVLKPRLLPLSLDAALILTQIGLLMVTHFGFHAFRQAASLSHGSSGPVTDAIAWLLRGNSSVWLLRISQVSYWAHLVILLGFLNYLPYSKHIHILGSLPNIFFRPLGPKGVMPKLNLENETEWGVGKITQFGQKSLLDQYACTECARCSNFCPAYQTSKPLSPMHLIHDLRAEITARMPLEETLQQLQKSYSTCTENDPNREVLEQSIRALQQQIGALPPLVGGRIQDETLWACTTCGACQEVCPVLIEHPLKIQQMKTHLVLAEGRIPAGLQRTFQNLERTDNPWGFAQDQRMDWSVGLTVSTIEQAPEAEYLLFVGCAGSFDERAKQSMRALVDVLQAAQVSFAVLGKKERCSGDPARRAGNEFLFQQQAESNITTMNQSGVRKVITNCPHCFHTIKNEYPQFGGTYEVIHHSQLIAHLLATGKLQPEQKIEETLTYHDSCYLGRWNGEYNAPREALYQITTKRIQELPRHRERSFCCGAGGGRMWQEEKGPRVNRNRAEEIMQTGTQIAAMACPFCTIMITDGIKDIGTEEKIQVLDIAEVVQKSLKRRAVLSSAPSPE